MLYWVLIGAYNPKLRPTHSPPPSLLAGEANDRTPPRRRRRAPDGARLTRLGQDVCKCRILRGGARRCIRRDLAGRWTAQPLGPAHAV